MMKDNQTSDANLHYKAEVFLKEKSALVENPYSESELLNFIHDLTIRQAELELRNEELFKTISSVQNTKTLYPGLVDVTALVPISENPDLIEERWRYATEGATDGMWDWNIVTNRVFFSAQWKAMLGFEESEIGDMLAEWEKRVHPNDLHSALLAINRNLSGESSSYSSEHRLLCKDGTYKWVLDEGKVVKRDENGKALRAIGTFKDITERKKTEHDLSERLKELNCHNRISEVMSNATLSTDEVIKEIVQLIPGGWQFPEMTEASVQINQVVFSTPGFKAGNRKTLESEIRTNGKAVGRIEVSYVGNSEIDSENVFLPEESNLLYSIAERLGRFIGNTENNLLLSESEQKYRNLVENISEVIYRIDNKGVITYISSSIEKIIGFTAEEIIGRSFIHFVGVNSEFLSQRLQELSTKKELNNEYKIVNKTGQPCWVRLSTKAISQDGDFIGAYGTLFDITEKKQAEQELQKSETLYKSILQASPDTIFIADLSGNVLLASPMAMKMFGYENIDFCLNRPLYNFIDPKDHDKAKEAIRQMFQGEFSGSTEYVGIKADASTFDMDVNGEFIRDSDGSPTSMIFIARDISDRKAAEKKLHESESLYRSVLNASPDTITITDLSGQVLFTSPKAMEMFRYYNPEEIIGHPLLDFIDEQSLAKAQNAIMQMFQGNFTGAEEYIGIRSDGSTFEIEVNGDFLRDTDGFPTKIVFVTRDISDRKAAEKKLIKSEEQYRKLVESVNDVIYEIDANGNIKYVSPSVIRVLGYSVEEVLGRNIFDFIYPEDRLILVNSLKNLSARDYNYMEYRYVRKDGSIHWVRSSTSSIMENGIFVGGTGILTDITERKIAELELVIAKEKSEESEKKFIAIIQSQSEGIGIVDKNECFEFVNLAAEKIFETNPGELIGESLLDFLSTEEKEKVNSETTQRENGNWSAYDLQIVTKNGNGKYVHISAVPKFDSNKNYLGAYAVFQDITERKNAEIALLDSEEKFSKAFQTAPYAISITSVEDGKFFEINDSFTVHTGYTKEEVYADSSIGLKLWADINDRNSVISDLSQGKEVLAKEYDFVKKSGKRVSCIFSASMILLNNKPYILSSITDISEIKQAQDQLRKLSRAVEQNPVSIVITNLVGNIEYANPKACETTGYTIQELIGQNPRLLKSGETLTNEYELLWENISTGNEWRGIFHNKRKNGELYWESSTISPITDADGNITHYLAIKEDITERKKTEEALIRSEDELNFAQVIASMSSWELDMLTEKLTWSKNYYQIMGIPTGTEMETGFFIERVHPEDLHIVNEKLDEVRQTKMPVTYDLRLRMPDNEFRWIQNNIVPEFEGENLIRLKGVNIDITEKKLAEEKIHLQNQRLSAIVGAMPDLMFVADTSGTYLEYYSSNPDLQVVTHDQIIGTNIREAFDAETADLHLRKIAECIKKQKLVTYDFSGLEKGVISFFEIRLAPLGIDSVLAFVRDITEEKLKDNEIKKLSLAVEQSPVLIIITNLNGSIEYVNPTFEATTGYTKEEIIGQNPRILKSDKTAAGVYAEMWKTITEGKQWFGELINRKKNGDLYWESISITPVRNESGKIISYLAVKQDITQRKQAEQEIRDLNTNLELKIVERTSQLALTNADLQSEIEERNRIQDALSKSEKNYRSVVENVNEVIFKTDTNGFWLFLNKSWETVTGFSVEESLGKHFVNYVHPSDRQQYMELFEPLIKREKETYRHEVRYITKDGGFRWIEVFARLSLNENDEVSGTFGTLQDITERKRAEDFEDELLQLSLQLTGIPGHEISSAINMALKRIGSFLDSDRAYIFELNQLDKTMRNTFEWCNKGINPEFDNLQDIPLEIFPMWMEQLHRFENIIIPSVSDLPESWLAEREILEPQGIKSLIVIPVFIDIDLIGFVGLDSVSKQKEYDSSEINILQVWSNMLAGLINNQRKELVIEQTRRNYETFFNTIDDFLFVLDEQGNILHTNNTVINRLGYAPAELLDKSVLMVHPAERREEAGRIVGEMLAGTTDFCPVPLLTKASTQISVETRVKPGFWDGKPVIFGVSKDVSKIRLSEEKFSRAFHSNSALMAISGFEDGRYMDVNNTFLETLGYSSNEIIGKNADELDIFVNAGVRRSLLLKLETNIPVREIELEVRTKSGTILLGLFSADGIYIGNDLCLLTVMVDITERKRAEEELKIARNEAEKANLAKSEFLSRMSHELRTPMNSILGFAQLMEMCELNPAHRKGVNHILKSGKHLLDLINEVLDISRIEAGRISLSIEPVRLRNAILEMLDIVQPQALERNQTVKLVESPTDHLYVLADNQRLKQVLLNLITNAVKYNYEGGSVQIKTELCQADPKRKSMIRISVMDTGIGIRAEEMNKLFHPFERIGAERTETEGTGLGLNVVKKLMEAMDGKVGVESIPGEGSTFWIELEHVEFQKISMETTSMKSIPGTTDVLKSGTIFYFEDNISNIELVDGILTNHRPHIQLVTSVSGKNAVELVKECKPDLILLDLDLPEIHGSEVFLNLQSNPETMPVPVVIISADAMSHQIKKMLKAGARDYLTKPIEIAVFLKMVDKWIEKKMTN